MRPEDFDFELPEELIAQYPAALREEARLMVLNRSARSIATGSIPDLFEHFRAGDLLVVNDTRVRPARLLGHKESGGRVEAFLVHRTPGPDEVWACLTRSSKPLRSGAQLLFPGPIVGTMLGDAEGTLKLIRFECSGDFAAQLEAVGRMPLPPYIHREDEALDRERYQTVYAAAPGAVAAPTAGLHFTTALLESLKRKGVIVAPLTLQVGIGTFSPVRVENLAEHRMHAETFAIPEATAQAVNLAKAEQRRVIAVGTTSTRTLESAARSNGRIETLEGETDIFIAPGFQFQIVDALMTNFHLPCSTLLMLVSAFAGREFALDAYRQAVDQRFRFFSYGDCMLIL